MTAHAPRARPARRPAALARTLALAAAPAAALVVVLVVVLAAVLTGAARPALAAGEERIRSFDVAVAVRASGAVSVTERITYDFGSAQRHGIFRYVPVRYPCRGAAVGPSCPKGKVRVLSLSGVDVRMDGGPVEVQTKAQGDSVVFRVGSASSTVTGAHAYELSYTLAGALNPTDDGGAVLPWNAVGSGWQVPIDAVRLAVEPGVGIVRTACTWGPPGATTSCGEASPYRIGPLAPGSDATLTVTLAPGAVATSAPILETPKRYLGPFLLGGGSYALSAVAALGGGLAVWRAGRRGRDRRFVGGDVEVAMGRAGQAEETKPVFADLPAVMEFAPPNGIRPGQLGALVDERVDGRDVSATIVDLAARGYLRLEQLDGGDWRIAAGRRTSRDAELLPYERVLLDNLLDHHDSVLLSSLRRTWAGSYKAVTDELYGSLVAAGWYTERPDLSRGKITGVGIGLAALGGLAIWFGRRGPLALAGVPLVVAGLVTALAVARYAGARTALGTAMAARCGGFRRLVETPTQQEMARFAERRDVFVEYLPFAIVFGCATQWAKRFADLGALPPPTVGWYVPMGHGAGAAGPADASWDAIAREVAGFAGSAASALSAPAASASGGGSSGSSGGGSFSSGGGFGGGGGGSW